MGTRNHVKPATILAFSEDRGLLDLLLTYRSENWTIEVMPEIIGLDLDSAKSSDDLTAYLNLIADSDCRAVVIDDGRLPESVRGWLVNRIHNWMPQAFIIYVASHHRPEVEVLARSRGASYYISKPVDGERLLHLIAGLKRHETKARRRPAPHPSDHQ